MKEKLGQAEMFVPVFFCRVKKMKSREKTADYVKFTSKNRRKV
jgi:hypothetical protein